MDKWYVNGILFNHLEHLPFTDLNAKVVDVFYNRDLFIDQVGGDVERVFNMWRVLRKHEIDWKGPKDRLIWMLASDGKFTIRSAW